MRINIKSFVVIALTMALASCRQQAEPVQYDLPVVEFPMPDESISTVIGEPQLFYVNVVSASKAAIGWYINGQMQSSSQRFTYVFDLPGDYVVSFIARNGAGQVQKDYSVHVAGDFRVRLSIGDSTRIFRKQLNPVAVAAIEELGAEISHEWIYEDETVCEKAYFNNFILEEAREYTFIYHGRNNEGSFTREFIVEVMERELEISFSILDSDISIKAGKYLTITATPLFGGTGLVHNWTVDDEEVSTSDTVMWLVSGTGTHVVKYTGVNAKGETVTRTWNVSVETSGYIFDSFEGITSLGAWWTLAQNQPGIELVENPLKAGINTSDFCLRDKVNGSTSTSGYFDLTLSKVLAAHPEIDVTRYQAVRVMVYLNGNSYFPRIQLGGDKVAPVIPAKSTTEWVTLEYRFTRKLTKDDKLTVRAMYNSAGSNISGFDEATNNRIVYFDDFEFVE